MTTFYADTSVLLKLHVAELGSKWCFRLVESTAAIATTELSIVEIYSAFNRLVREGRLKEFEYRELLVEVDALFATRYGVMPISKEIIDIACGVLEQHPLRAYDSIHLASALFTNRRLLSVGQPALTFLSSDFRLLAAATTEGLLTFDPSTAA